MLSLCISHVATVASSFRYSVFHFLAKLFKICKIFFSCENKTMNINTSSHRKGNFMALTAVYQFELWLKVRDMPSKLSLPRHGLWSLVWVKQVFELSEVELTEFHCTWIITTFYVKSFSTHSVSTAWWLTGNNFLWWHDTWWYMMSSWWTAFYGVGNFSDLRSLNKAKGVMRWWGFELIAI